MSEARFPHLNAAGDARMVDVSAKAEHRPGGDGRRPRTAEPRVRRGVA